MGGSAAGDGPPADGQGLQVLVVEDDPADRAMVVAALAGTGSPTVVHEAATLAVAHDLLAAQPVDVVLLDLGLPDADDVSALASLLTIRSAPPIVVVTGRDEERLGERTVRLGATDFLTKDMLVGGKSARILDRVLRHAIARHRQRLLLERESAELRLLSVRQQGLIDRISSDLQGPVAGLYGLVSTLAERLPSMKADERRQLLDKVLSSATQLGVRLTELVADAQGEAGPREALDMAEVVPSAINSVDGRPEGTTVRLAGDLPRIWGHRVGLQEAIAELLRNAVIHAPGDGPPRVEVEVAPYGAGVRVTVSDDGESIPPARRADVFEPGVTLDARSRRAGMGLAVVRATAVQHGGSAWVDGRADGGNAVTITIPQRGRDRGASQDR